MRCMSTMQLRGAVSRGAVIEGPPIESLDPIGIHAVDHHMMTTDGVVKCKMLFKVPDYGEGVPGKLVLSVEDFNAMPDVEEVLLEARELEGME